MRKSVPLLRAAAFMLAAALSLPLVQAAEAAWPFSDVPADAWYAPAAEYTVQHGLMAGTDPGLFSPDAVMTRGMLVTILYRMAGSPSLEDENLGYPFADVPGDSWCADGVYWARLEGFAAGYGGDRFGPDDPVTREQLAAILWRYAGCPQTAQAEPFADQASIASWAGDAVDWARSAGLLAGKPGSLFDPAGQATRAEGAVILSRYHQLAAQAPEEPGIPEVPVVPEEPDDPIEAEPEPDPWEGLVALNPYDREAFVVENGFLTYTGDAASSVGIDVSAHQGLIDWDRVAAAGVDFAMIRAGYRGYTQGGIYQDPYFTYNITHALRAGLDVGIYFYSQATAPEEAREEALQTLAWVEGYDITYPVVFDWERVSGENSRTDQVSGQTITACAQVFCSLVEEAGYTAMTYGSPSKVGDDLDLSQLSQYGFWLAHYTIGWRPTGFTYHFDMWQYSSSGAVDGIDGRVDLNLCLTDWSAARGE